MLFRRFLGLPVSGFVVSVLSRLASISLSVSDCRRSSSCVLRRPNRRSWVLSIVRVGGPAGETGRLLVSATVLVLGNTVGLLANAAWGHAMLPWSAIVVVFGLEPTGDDFVPLDAG